MGKFLFGVCYCELAQDRERKEQTIISDVPKMFVSGTHVVPGCDCHITKIHFSGAGAYFTVNLSPGTSKGQLT
jgi:hypothetical protein